MFQILSTTNNRTYLRIPPTEIGGLFRSYLQKGCSGTGKSPQRQLGDCSDPTYRKSAGETLESPQRQLGDCSDPTYRKPHAFETRNPPNGSWGIVQIQPTKKCATETAEIPPTAVGGLFRSCLRSKRSRLFESAQPRLVNANLHQRLWIVLSYEMLSIVH